MRKIMSILILSTLILLSTACSNSSNNTMSEKEYAEVINQYLNELETKLSEQIELIRSKQLDMNELKVFQDYLWDAQVSIASLSPPKKFEEDNKKILNMYRTYIKSVQKNIDYQIKHDSDLLSESSDLAMDALAISEDLEYFNAHGEYRAK